MQTEDIKAKVKGRIGREILFYQTVSSTNTIALDLAEKGKTEGAVVLADSQEKGKGRLGRTWVSPPGVNVYMSIITRPEIKPKDVTLITLMTAIACTTALRKVTGLNITIKWPNDLIVSDKKLGGILTETKTSPERINIAIIGIGINVNMDIDAIPDDLKDIVTSIKIETGKTYSRAELIAEILNEIDKWYNILNRTDRERILSEWKQLTSTLGKEVMVTVGNETFFGLAEFVDDEGMLILRLQSGMLKRINTGDLTIYRC
ncbi:MAG: biotin--[acetyl-CoA-carboxylase] ligase [Nitrospirota bacterium]